MNNDDLLKMLTVVSFVVTSTGITLVYAWQIIFSIPLLASMVGIVTGVTIIVAEILGTWWAFNFVSHQKKVQDRHIKELERNLHGPPIPPIPPISSNRPRLKP